MLFAQALAYRAVSLHGTRSSASNKIIINLYYNYHKFIKLQIYTGAVHEQAMHAGWNASTIGLVVNGRKKVEVFLGLGLGLRVRVKG